MTDNTQTVTDVTPKQPGTEQPDPNAKNVINYGPVFPILTASVNLDLDFEDTLSQIYKTVGEVVNSPSGYTSLSVDPDAVKKLPLGQEIEGAIYGITTSIMDEIKIEYDKEKCMIRTWLNVVRKDNHVPRMHYPHAQYAGAIILKGGSDCSPIIFHNPTEQMRGHMLAPMRVKDLGPFTASSITLEAVPGRFYVWPAWCQTEVPPMPVGGPLIYVAFTIDFLPSGA